MVFDRMLRHQGGWNESANSVDPILTVKGEEEPPEKKEKKGVLKRDTYNDGR